MVAIFFWAVSFEANATTYTVTVNTADEFQAALDDVNNTKFKRRDILEILLASQEFPLLIRPEILYNWKVPKNTFPDILIAPQPGADVSIVGGGPGSDFGFINASPTSGDTDIVLKIEGIDFRDFHTEGNGAIIFLDSTTAESGSKVTVILENCTFENISAANGGVASVSGEGSSIIIRDSTMDDISVSGSGAILSADNAASFYFVQNAINKAVADQRAAVINATAVDFGEAIFNTIHNSFGHAQFASIFRMSGNTITNKGNHIDFPPLSINDQATALGAPPSNAVVNVSNNSTSVSGPNGAAIADTGSTLTGADVNMWLNMVQTTNGARCTAHPFAGTEINFVSWGGSVTDDLECTAFNNPGDIKNLDLKLANTLIPERFSPVMDVPMDFSAFDTCPRANSSSLRDSGNHQQASACTDPGQPGVLPCGYKDIRGFARPQDGDLNGSFDCDAGAYEVQGGADIGSSQSAAYFDIAHNQEGYFAEMLADGRVVIGVFTYKRDGTAPAWYTGVGQVVGNSFVVDDLVLAKGGVFGVGFDASSITRTTVAGFSANFPDCEATTNPGRWVIDPVDNISIKDPRGAVTDAELVTLLEEQIQLSSRLGHIIDCPASGPAGSDTSIETHVEAQSPNAFRSGTYFDLARSGEGIFVQVLTDGTLVVMWYTFDPQGNPMWILATGTLVGNTTTINARYPTQFTHFGSTFDPSEIVLSDWGTFTLTFTDCNTLIFAYASTVAAYGSGSLNYTRLTQLAGTSCPS